MSKTAEPCPACGKPAGRTPENPWRPFCSERCKLTDLGLWFAERYTIPDDDDGTPPSSGRPQ